MVNAAGSASPTNELQNLFESFNNTDSKKEEQSPPKPSVELFFSFDVVNSSTYKEENRLDWPRVIHFLLKEIQKKTLSFFIAYEFHLWRVVGDEMIFVLQISDKNDLHSAVQNIFQILYMTNVQLQNGSFFEQLFEKDKYNTYKSAATLNTLSLQAAAWIAKVVPCNAHNQDQIISQVHDKYANLSVYYFLEDDKTRILEFLGPDIDAGFRVKAYTQARRLVVSFELAFLLAEKTEVVERLHIMTYRNLKGIWHGALYPVIWYHNSDIAKVSFNDSFRYDEHINNPIAFNHFLRVNSLSRTEPFDPPLDDKMYTDLPKALKKLALDQGLDTKLQGLVEVIGNMQPTSTKKIFEDSTRETFHCAAVCCDPVQKKVLIAKRTHRGPNQDCWEFGCAKANFTKTLVATIIEEYKRDFSIDIEPLIDTRRDDQQPLPLSLYDVQKDGCHHTGVIVVAKIINDYNLTQFGATSKHSEVRWITPDEVDHFTEKAVPDFKATLKKIFEDYEKLFPNDK